MEMVPRTRHRRIYRGPIYEHSPQALVSWNLRMAVDYRQTAVEYFARAKTFAGEYVRAQYYRDEARRAQDAARGHYTQAGLLHHILRWQELAPQIEAAEKRVEEKIPSAVRARYFASIRYVNGRFAGAIYSYYTGPAIGEVSELRTLEAVEAALGFVSERLEIAQPEETRKAVAA